MRYNPDPHHRRSIRLPGYDHTAPGAYFLTICTYERAPLPGSIPTIVRAFKSATTKRVNTLRDMPSAPLWQRNYYELSATMPTHRCPRENIIAKLHRGRQKESQMTTNRFIFVALCLAISLPMFIACGRETETPSPPPTIPPAIVPSPTPAPPEPAAPSPTPTSPQTAPSPAPPDGAALLQERCSLCHTLDRVRAARKGQDAWEQTVDRMIRRGAQLNEEERVALIAYLVREYGP